MNEVVAHEEPPLKWPLVGIAVLVAMTLGLVALTRLAVLPASQQSISTAPIAARELRFDDRLDGGIDVIDGRTGAVVEALEPGTHGFIRGVLRAFARDRMLRHVGSGPTFLITQHSDGIVSIEDTATHQRVALNGFGQTNAGAFVRLIRPEAPRP